MVKTERLHLERVAFLGRTFREYTDMFGLDHEVLSMGRVLDCPAGPSSFSAEASGMGARVTASDLLYGLSPEELLARAEADTRIIYEQLDDVMHLYTWGYYRNKDEVAALRKRAFALFGSDFPTGRREGRYVEAALPRLPFPDGMFSLVLSGHFLFLYSDRMDLHFHVACLRELLRVCSGEVRVFPLQGLDGMQSPHLKRTIQALEKEGMEADMVRVPLEFQRGGNVMLRIKRT